LLIEGHSLCSPRLLHGILSRADGECFFVRLVFPLFS
jgi:hypothetical protein